LKPLPNTPAVEAPDVIEETKDDSLDCFILETLHQMLLFNASTKFHDKEEKVANLRGKLLPYVLDRLDFRYHSAVKFQAQLCLAVLSVDHLQQVCEMLVNRQAALKPDQTVRELPAYQRAAKMVAFTIRTTTLASVTLDYLERINIVYSRIDKGFLKQCCCESVGAVLNELMSSDKPERREEWNTFLRTGGDLLRRFWNGYNEIFKTVQKWSKKGRFTTCCVELMRLMVCLGDAEMFLSKSKQETLRALTDGLKDKNSRTQSLEMIKDFVRQIRPELLTKNMEVVTKDLQTICNELYPQRKMPIIEGEGPLLIATMIEIGRKHLHFGVQTIETMLKSDKYHPDYKQIALRAVAVLGHEMKKELGTYNYVLAPLIFPLIEKPTEYYLLRAAIPCFPVVENPNEERQKKLVSVIASYTLDEDREIAVAATISLQELLHVRPADYTVFTLTVLVDTFATITTLSQDAVFKHFNNLAALFRVYPDYAAHLDPPAKLDPFSWIVFRTRFEAACLRWFSHSESWIRNEAHRLMIGISRPEYRAIEEGAPSTVAKTPYLADAFPKEIAPDNRWPPEMGDFLKNQREQYDAAISIAWAILQARWTTLAAEVLAPMPPQTGGNAPQPPPTNDRLELWTNLTRFLAMSVRMLTKEGEKELPAAGIEGAVISRADAVKFLAELAAICTRSSTTKYSETMRQEALIGVELLHPSCHEVFLGYVKAASEKVTQDRIKARRKGLPVPEATTWEAELCGQEAIFETVARVYCNVDVKDLKDSPSPLQIATLAGCIAAWTTDPSQKHMRLSVNMKRYAAEVMVKYLELAGLDRSNRTGLLNGPSGRTPLESIGFRRQIFRALSTWWWFGSSASGTNLSEGAMQRIEQIAPPSAKGVDSSYGEMDNTMDDGTEMPRDLSNEVWQLEEHVLRAVVALLRIGCMENKELEDQILNLLHSFFEKGDNRNNQHADAAFTVFLEHNPHRLRSLIQGSCPETHASVLTSQAACGAVSLCYLRSLVRNFIGEGVSELALSYGVHSAKMLHLSLLHQCSPLAMARQQAVILANALAKRDVDHVDAGEALAADTHRMPYLYGELARRYSQTLALKYRSLTVPLLEEAVALVSGGPLSVATRESMMQVLLPWLRNFGWILGKALSSSLANEVFAVSKKTARPFLDMLFQFTRLCQAAYNTDLPKSDAIVAADPTAVSAMGPSTLLSRLVQSMWVALVSDPEYVPFTVPEVVDFILDRFGMCEVDAQGYYSTSTSDAVSSPDRVSGDRALCRSIIVYLTRAGGAGAGKMIPRLVFDRLLESLRNYGPEGVVWGEKIDWSLPLEVIPRDVSRQSSPADMLEGVKPWELAAVQLLVDLVCELDLLVVPHLPLLLLTSFALYHSNCLVKFPERDELVYNLLQSIAIRHALTGEARARALRFVREHFMVSIIPNESLPELLQNVTPSPLLRPDAQKVPTPSPEEPKPKPKDHLVELIDILAESRNMGDNLRAEMCKLALAWAVRSSDRDVSLQSLRVFALLHGAAPKPVVDVSLLRLLSRALAEAMKNGDEPSKVRLISNTFLNLPKNQASALNDECWDLITAVGIVALGLPEVENFSIGLHILSQVFVEDHETINKSQVIKNCETIWIAGTTVDDNGEVRDNTLDENITNTLFKGFSTVTTCESTLTVLESIASLYSKGMRLDNKLMVTAALVHAFMSAAKIKDSSYAKKASKWLSGCGYKLDQLESAFTSLSSDTEGALSEEKAKTVAQQHQAQLPTPMYASTYKPQEHALDILAQMLKPRQAPQTPRGRFLEAFATGFCSAFTRASTRKYTLRTITYFIQRGLQSWQSAALETLYYMSRELSKWWDAGTFEDTLRVVFPFTYSSDPEMASTAEKLVTFMIQNCPPQITQELERGSGRVIVREVLNFFGKPKAGTLSSAPSNAFAPNTQAARDARQASLSKFRLLATKAPKMLSEGAKKPVLPDSPDSVSVKPHVDPPQLSASKGRSNGTAVGAAALAAGAAAGMASAVVVPFGEGSDIGDESEGDEDFDENAEDEEDDELPLPDSSNTNGAPQSQSSRRPVEDSDSDDDAIKI